MISFEEIKTECLEAGFADAKIAALSCAEAWVKSCLVLFMPYKAALPPDDGKMPLSGYYPASNAAWHAGRRLIERLSELGVCARENDVISQKQAAALTGGSFGINSLYIHPQLGSMVYIYTILTNIVPKEQKIAEAEENELCRSCGRCIAACPTGALPDNMDNCLRRLINRHEIPLEGKKNIYQLFGCEKCQTCCPYNSDPFEKGRSYSLEELLSNDTLEELRGLIGPNVARRMRIEAQARAFFEDAIT